MAAADKSHRHSLAAPVLRTSPSTPPGAAPALPRIPLMSPIGTIDETKDRLQLPADRPWPFRQDSVDSVTGLPPPTSPADEHPPAAAKKGLGRSATMKSPLSILRRKWPGFSVITQAPEEPARDESGRQLSSRPSSLDIRNVPRQPSPTLRLVDLAVTQVTVHDENDRPPTPPQKDTNKRDSRGFGRAQFVKARRRSDNSLQSPRQLGLVPSPTPSLSCESATAASILGDSSPDSSSRPSIEIMPGSLGVEVMPVDDGLLVPPKRSSSLDRVEVCECSICLRSKGKLAMSLP